MNAINGSIKPAINAPSQTINVAASKLEIPPISIPSRMLEVMNSPASVVKSATPPDRAGTLLAEIFTINGLAITSIAVKIKVAVMKDNISIEKPGNRMIARKSPIALAAVYSSAETNK